jgi:hypothetical protein
MQMQADMEDDEFATRLIVSDEAVSFKRKSESP